MEYSTSNSILQERGLKRTKLRLALLNCFMNANNAQSYLDIKTQLGQSIDKSTLYRNLSAFEDAGIIHRINDQSGVSKYAYGKVHDHGVNHAHFVCDQCKTIYCMERSTSVDINVPKGFKTKDVQTIIKGTCPNC